MQQRIVLRQYIQSILFGVDIFLQGRLKRLPELTFFQAHPLPFSGSKFGQNDQISRRPIIESTCIYYKTARVYV